MLKDFIVGLGVKLDQLINKETLLLLTAQGSASLVLPPFVKQETEDKAPLLPASFFIVGLGVKINQLINKETMLLITAQGSAFMVPPPFVNKKGYLLKVFIVGLGVKLDQLINKEPMLLMTAQGYASIVPPPFVKKETEDSAPLLPASEASVALALLSPSNSLLTVQGQLVYVRIFHYHAKSQFFKIRDSFADDIFKEVAWPFLITFFKTIGRERGKHYQNIARLTLHHFLNHAHGLQITGLEIS